MRVISFRCIFCAVILILLSQRNRTVRIGLPRLVPCTSYMVFLYKEYHALKTVVYSQQATVNPYVTRCINYVDGRVCLAVLTAAKTQCTALYKLAVNALRGKTVDLRAFQVAAKAA